MAENREFPSDLLLAGSIAILTDIFVLVPALSCNFILTALSLAMLLFFPGYVLIAALFPAKKDLDGIERTALSFGLSVVVVPLIGPGLNHTSWGIRLLPILISLSIFTFVMCGVAYRRRKQFPGNKAFLVSFKINFLNLKANVFEKSAKKTDKILMVILVFSILASVGTLL